MTYDEKVAWLRRYQDSLRRERELVQEVEALRSRACRTSAALSAAPGGSDGQGLPRAVEAILAAQAALAAQVSACQAARAAVAGVIEMVRDPRDREILRRRYLLGQRWETIAVEMHLEYRWVTRRHRRAVERMILTPESPT